MGRLDRDRAIQDLTPALNVIYGAVEGGITQARDYIESRGGPYNSFYYGHSHAQLFRDHIVDTLSRTYIQPRLVLERLTNSGLSIIAGEYQMKLWKAQKGQMHPPGYSRSKLQYLQQRKPRQHYLEYTKGLRLHPAFAPFYVQYNLCILWTINNLMELESLELAYTKDATPYGVTYEWRYLIPHPLAHYGPNHAPLSLAPPSLFDDGDVDDIELLDSDAESGQQT